MLPTERISYSPINARKPLKLPDGARMAVWVIVNVEEWDATQPMPRTVLTPPAGGSPSPDIPNWAWHEYGNRVGFWRMLKVFDEFKIPGVLAINGSALAAYPPIVEAALERNWEFMGIILCRPTACHATITRGCSIPTNEYIVQCCWRIFTNTWRYLLWYTNGIGRTC